MKNIFLLQLLAILITSCSEDDDSQSNQTNEMSTEFSVISEEGGRVSWSHTENVILFDKESSDGFLDVYKMSVDGSNLINLTQGRANLSEHNGQPTAHPIENFIIFQSGNSDYGQLGTAAQHNYLTNPGIGLNNDFWVTNYSGTSFWKIYSTGRGEGLLHPHFSDDGTKMVWAETRIPWSFGQGQPGFWQIKIADFNVVNGVPSLSNIDSIQPGNLQLYETNDLSADGNIILFSGIINSNDYFQMEIFSYNISTGAFLQLTNDNNWDEFAVFSPNETQIIFASSKDIDQQAGNGKPIKDYWKINLDGTGRERLTWLNPPNEPVFGNASDFDWSPDHKSIVLGLRDLTSFNKKILIIDNFWE